jgi:hypothetical protein
MDSPPYSERGYAVPDEHRAFLDAFDALMRAYPDAAQRFGLLDFENNRQRDVRWELECYPFGDWTVCDFVPRAE